MEGTRSTSNWFSMHCSYLLASSTRAWHEKCPLLDAIGGCEAIHCASWHGSRCELVPRDGGEDDLRGRVSVVQSAEDGHHELVEVRQADERVLSGAAQDVLEPDEQPRQQLDHRVVGLLGEAVEAVVAHGAVHVPEREHHEYRDEEQQLENEDDGRVEVPGTESVSMSNVEVSLSSFRERADVHVAVGEVLGVGNLGALLDGTGRV